MSSKYTLEYEKGSNELDHDEGEELEEKQVEESGEMTTNQVF